MTAERSDRSRRRMVIYFSWDFPAEAAQELGVLEHRFPALHELRRALWPNLEVLRDAPQGIAGFLERIVLGDFEALRSVALARTGHEPEIVSRRDATGTLRRIDSALLTGMDTLLVVSLDHVGRTPPLAPAEVAEVEGFLQSPSSLLLVSPHHFVGDVTGELSSPRNQQEHAHHGDALVPAVQRLGGLARDLLLALGIPVENVFGLRPALDAAGKPAPIAISQGLDDLGLLTGVRTFNAHGHLPHLRAIGTDGGAYRVLARQRIDDKAPQHPSGEFSSGEFDALLWAPPAGKRAGHVVVCDATLWSSAFGGTESLRKFWENVLDVAAPEAPGAVTRARR